MKRSCLVYLSVFLSVGLLGGIALLQTILDDPPGEQAPLAAKLIVSMLFSFGASAFVTLALTGFRDVAERLRDRAQVGAANVSFPADGDRAVAFGRLVRDGPELESPFTRTPCACYSYEVRVTSKGKNKSDVLCLWGFALTPSHVATGWGGVRLLTFLNLEEDVPPMRDAETRERASEYFGRTTLVPIGFGALSTAMEAQRTLHLDDDGTLKGDFGTVPSNFAEGEYRLYEKLLVDGDEVTAIGTWDLQRGGVRGKPGSEIISPVIVRKGPAEKTRATLMSQAIRSAAGALVMLAIAGGIVWGFFAKGREFL